jgi:hypothetical protein
LPIEGLQFLIKFRVSSPEDPRLLEEAFRCHGEELGRVGCSVLIQHAGTAQAAVPLEPLILVVEHPSPGDVLAGLLQEWCAVECTILSVQLVGEFVQDEVFSVVEVGGTGFHVIPREHDDSAGRGFAERLDFALQNEMAADMSTNRPDSLGNISAGINQDRDQAGINIREEAI